MAAWNTASEVVLPEPGVGGGKWVGLVAESETQMSQACSAWHLKGGLLDPVCHLV